MHKLMKQQNVTTISAEAELCRAINGHGDLQELTDTGPWTARLLCPCFLPALVQREAPRVLIHSWQTETRSGQKTQLKLSHSSTDLSLTRASVVTERCSRLLSRSRNLSEAITKYTPMHQNHQIIGLSLSGPEGTFRLSSLISYNTCQVVSGSNA